MSVYRDEDILAYCESVSTTPSATAERLEAETRAKVEMSGMLSGSMEGSLLGLLTRISGAKRVLEFGTYTGYSALVFAENLPADGTIHTIDINPDTVAFGLAIAKESPHGAKIHSHIGNGLEIAKELPGLFDIVFIDADKTNYLNYFKLGAEKLAPGGLIILDNALWGGSVLDDKDDSPAAVALRQMNSYLKASGAFHKTLVPIRDGVFIATKIG